jgi:hypothetical protein
MPQDVENIFAELKEIEATITEFAKKLDRLKILYEQYFMGINKREPLVPLKDVVRIMRALDQKKIRNTGLRFRYRSLVQKFNSYRTFWHRTIREIERGTYHRDLAKTKRNLAKKGISMPTMGRVRSPAQVERAVADAVKAAQTGEHQAITETTAQPADEQPPAAAPVIRGKPADEIRQELTQDPALGPIDLGDQQQVQATPTPRPTPTPPAQARATQNQPTLTLPPEPPPAQSKPRPTPPPSSKIPDQMSEEKIQAIYRSYVKAKKMCGEDSSKVRYESVAKSINSQLPKLKEKYKGRQVEFQVVIRDGRAILKAKAK